MAEDAFEVELFDESSKQVLATTQLLGGIVFTELLNLFHRLSTQHKSVEDDAQDVVHTCHQVGRRGIETIGYARTASAHLPDQPAKIFALFGADRNTPGAF